MPEMTVSFPHMGGYAAEIAQLFRRLFPKATILTPPPITNKTLELGGKYSPDFVCAPFKYNLGNYIQALERGTDVLFQTGTGCRYGYYGELQEQILRDLGYRFKFVCLSRQRLSPRKVLRVLRDLGCALPVRKILHAALLTLLSIRAQDRYEYWMRENMAFERRPGACEAVQKQLLRRMETINSFGGLRAAARYAKRAVRRIELERPERPLRIGIVGELYTLMEPFSNFDIEKQLAAAGFSVSRAMGIWFLFARSKRRSLRRSGKYLRYTVGANGVDSVSQSLAYARKGYDGILHLKSFGCIPELNAGPALDNLSRDCEIPILHLSFDTHSSQTGVQTRLEAFTDMLRMRREDEDHGKPGRGYRLGIDQSGGA